MMRLIQASLSHIKQQELLRFNLLLLVFVWGLILTPIALALYSLKSTGIFIILFFLAVTSFWLFILLKASLNIKKISTRSNDKNSLKKAKSLIFICLYKEPLEVIEETLQSLALQSIKKELTVVLAFESTTPKLDFKTSKLKREFDDIFQQLLITVHPANIKGEIPGKCSNVNYSVRQVVKQLNLNQAEFDSTIVTTCDADNLFDKKHFELLRNDFLADSDRHQCVWQAPLFYDWNSTSCAFLARITGILRSVNMLGALIPLQINTMSIQSLSLKLLAKGDYYHPNYQMEDILNVVRWMTETRNKVKIRMLKTPIISGPTSGVGLIDEFHEWRLQARRWAPLARLKFFTIIWPAHVKFLWSLD